MAERPEDSSAEITIKAASIDTGNADRDKHVRSPDFLNVDRFPELRFRSTKVEFPGEDRIALTGDLTIRDVTKSAVLDAEFTGMSQDPWGNPRGGIHALGTPRASRSTGGTSGRAGTWLWRLHSCRTRHGHPE